MQQHTRRLMVYDITCKKRLQRVHRRCCQDALALQNSVFLYQGKVQNWLVLWADLQTLLDVSEDAFWVFELDLGLYCQQLGCKPLPEGLLVLGGTCLSDIIT